MTRSSDVWSEWVLERRYGKDAQERDEVLAFLTLIRDRVLAGAKIEEGATVLDVGCGDGFLAFAALDQIGPSGQVIFSDISPALLDTCQEIAEKSARIDQCTFVRARASDLTKIPDASIDAVVFRSVLVYEEAKAQAFREFFRVLRSGGRLSCFEPINRFGQVHETDESDKVFLGYKVPEIASLAAKVQAAHDASTPLPMINFDERDLLRFAGDAGFTEVSLDYEARIEPNPPFSWETLIHRSPNPHAATLDETLDRVLTPAEKERFIAVLRPRVEQGGGQLAYAEACLRAQKHYPYPTAHQTHLVSYLQNTLSLPMTLRTFHRTTRVEHPHEALTRLLRHAVGTVPFYQRQKQQLLASSSLPVIEWLQHFPFIDRRTLRTVGPDMISSALTESELAVTSGTTDTPLSSVRDPAAYQARNTIIEDLHQITAPGMTWCKSAFLIPSYTDTRSPVPAHSPRRGTHKKQRLFKKEKVFETTQENLASILSQWQPDVLIGTPRSLLAAARALDRQHSAQRSAFLSIDEPLLPPVEHALANLAEGPIIDIYAMREIIPPARMLKLSRTRDSHACRDLEPTAKKMRTERIR